MGADRQKQADSIRRKTEQIHKERKEKKRKAQGRPPLYQSSKAYAYRIAAYMLDCDSTTDDKGRTLPYTITGLQIATGLTSGVYERYRNGTHDKTVIDNTILTDDGVFIEDGSKIYDSEKAYIYDCQQVPALERYMQYLYDNRTLDALYFSTIDKKARTLIEQQAEQRLYMRGSVADIFTVKSRYGWTDEQTTVHRLEIATSEDARKALEDLRLLSE